MDQAYPSLSETPGSDLDLTVQALSARARSAQSSAIASLDADPEKAVRAQQIAPVVGVPPVVVYGDYDQFNREAESQLTTGIVAGNARLRTALAEDPMFGALAKGDYAKLDELSSAMDQGWLGSARKWLDRHDPVRQGIGGFARGFAEGFAKGNYGEWAMHGLTPEQIAKNRMPLSVLTATFMPVEAVFKAFAGGVEGLAQGVSESLTAAGVEPNKAQRISREIAAGAEWYMTQPGGVTGGHAPAVDATAKLASALRTAEAFARDGREIPTGLHPVLDEVKAVQSEAQVARLGEAVASVQDSALRERSPETFAKFLAEHEGARDTTVGISGDAIRELYGDRVPEPGDGMLGWIPDLAERTKLTEATGGDVTVPLADYLAHMTLEAHAKLEPSLRVDHGLSRVDAEVMKEREALNPQSMTLLHGVQEGSNFTGFKPLSEVDPVFRYDGGGAGVLGDYTYLDPTGKWVQGDQGALGINQAYRVKADFKNLFILTPDNVDALVGIVGKDAALKGRDLAKALHEKGYDGIQVKGFDALKGDIAREAELAKKVDGDIFQDQVVSFEPEKNLKAEGQVIPKRPDFIGMEEGPAKEAARAEYRAARQKAVDDALKADPVPELRRASGLEPSRPDTGVRMERVETKVFDNQPTHTYSITTADGAEGRLKITEERGGKVLYVDDMFVNGGPGSTGTGSVKQLLRQLVREFPNAEKLIGDHVAGTGAESGKRVEIDLTKVRPAAEEAPAAPPAEALKPDHPLVAEIKRVLETVGLKAPEASVKPAPAFDAPLDATKRMQQMYERHAEAQRQEDIAAEQRRIDREQKARESRVWREREPEVRQEVIDWLDQQPDFALDSFLRETGGQSGKMSPEGLTPEQRAALPDVYFSKRGLDADLLADMAGFRSVGDMVEALRALNERRGEQRYMDFRRRVIGEEVERRMMERYGDEMKPVEDVVDRLASAGEFERLHEQTMALAQEHGLEFTIRKADFDAALADQYSKKLARDATLDHALRELQKAGREVEVALLRGDFQEALRWKQRQYAALHALREAKAFEKTVERLERLADRYEKRKVSGVEQGFADYIQQLLIDSGHRVARTLDEIKTSTEAMGYKSLDDFITQHEGMGWDFAVSPELRVERPKNIEAMTVQEVRDLHDAIKSLNHIGREVNKIEMAGAKEDFQKVKNEILENIRSRPPRDPKAPRKLLFRVDAELTKMEQILKDLDLREDLGPMWTAVFRPMMDSKFKELNLQQDLVRKLQSMREDWGRDWRRSLKDSIPNDFLYDPYFDGVLFDLTRENMIQMMLNFGNRSNIDKFTRAYAGKGGDPKALEARLRQLFEDHATKKDWDYVQEIWNLFEGWRQQADTVHRNLSGVAPKWVDPEPFKTRHGDYAGGYYPIIYDRVRSGIEAIEGPGADALFNKNYFRATTSHGGLKARTGYADYVDFHGSLEQVAGRMQQTIHDIAYRDAIIQAGKIIYDKEIQGAIRKHYGAEYADQLKPWLKDIANHFNEADAKTRFYESLMRQFRFNLMQHALPFNLKVLLSPSTGALTPADFARFNANRAENVALAYKHSREIPHTIFNMDRDFREGLERAVRDNDWSSIQEKAVRAGYKGVTALEQELRTMTFVKEFQREREAGRSELDAAAIADQAVRQRHGGSSVAELPAIMRGSEFMKTMTMFYGYFNTIHNWRRELPEQLRRVADPAKRVDGDFSKLIQTMYGAVLIPAMFNSVLFQNNKKDDSWFKIIGKALVAEPLSTVPVLRDVAPMAFEGLGPRTPAGAVMQGVVQGVNDVVRVSQGKKVEKPIQHGANAIGLMTGLPLMQVGKTGQFIHDYMKGTQRPKNIIEWAKGILNGEIYKKR